MQNVRLRQELVRALQDAQAAESAKDAFLASMSREIRTPLSGLATVADMLARTQLDTRQQQLCAVMRSSAQDVVQLVCDILDFARLEAGQANLYQTRFDLGATIEAAARPHAERAAGRGLSFAVEIAPEAHGVFLGDDMRVKQIVDHLAANAVKFTDRGGVTVRIEEEERVGPRSMFKLSVIDTGLGFEEGAAAEMFEGFVQGEAAAGRGGAGLGLALADALARAMGGAISATSQTEQGSTFTVRLPLERAMEDFAAAQRVRA
jgi:signal transduction histidine kinase